MVASQTTNNEKQQKDTQTTSQVDDGVVILLDVRALLLDVIERREQNTQSTHTRCWKETP